MSSKNVIVSQPLDFAKQLSLNRPEKRNALNGELIQELIELLQEEMNQPATRVIVLTGEGDHFCSGADIAWMQKMATLSHQENVNDALQLGTLLRLIYTYPKPIIAGAKGTTLGGGLGILACCDIVIARKDASFCFSEIKLGLSPSMISPYVVPLIGERAARYYFLTAKRFDAKEALKVNLVQEIVEPSNLMTTITELAQSLRSHSPMAMTQAKRMIQHVTQETYSEKLIWFTAEHLATMRSSKDAKEGLNAFLEKRTPNWSSS